MRLCNINDNVIRTIECLYNKATSAVYHDNNIGEWFQTTTGVRQGCLLSPTFFNISLARVMADALEDHEGIVSIENRTITKKKKNQIIWTDFSFWLTKAKNNKKNNNNGLLLMWTFLVLTLRNQETAY